MVHRLVVRAFLGPCPPGKQVNHRNGSKTDNRASNLEYVTGAENYAHGERLGLMHKACGEQHGHSRINTYVVREIRRLRAEGLTLRTIGEQFGITETHVCRVAKGRQWAHVK